MNLYYIIGLSSILGISICGCVHAGSQEKNDLSETDLRGKVKSIVTSYYPAQENFEGKVVLGERAGSDTQIYNENGYLLSNIHSYAGPEVGESATVSEMMFSIPTKLTRILNSKNRPLEETLKTDYSKSSSIIGKRYEYYLNDTTLKHITVTENDSFGKSECDTLFDKLGNPIECYKYYFFGFSNEKQLEAKTIFRYNYVGEKMKDKYTKNIYYERAGSVVSDSTVFLVTENNIFDSFDNIIEYKKTVDTLYYSKNISKSNYYNQDELEAEGKSAMVRPKYIRTVIKFDDKGKKCISVENFANGVRRDRTVFQYNGKGTITKESYFIGKDSSIYQYTYNSQKLIKIECRKNTKTVSLEEYDGKGKLIHEAYFDEIGNLIIEYKYLYSKFGGQFVTYQKDNSKIVEYKYAFDQEGHLVRMGNSDGSSCEYKNYDMYKNWTVRYIYENGVLVGAVKRTIEYYI